HSTRPALRLDRFSIHTGHQPIRRRAVMSRVFAYVLAVGVLASSASAQPLTIAAAIDEAVQHNLSLLAARSSLTIADAQMVSARVAAEPGAGGKARPLHH